MNFPGVPHRTSNLNFGCWVVCKSWLVLYDEGAAMLTENHSCILSLCPNGSESRKNGLGSLDGVADCGIVVEN